MIVYDIIEHAYSDVPEKEAMVRVLSGTHVNVISDAQLAHWYARDIIGGRWPEAEPYIMKEALWAFLYSDEVIGGRWPEAEPYIKQDIGLYNTYMERYGND